LFRNIRRDVGLLKRSPFEVFFVPSTFNIPPLALLTARLDLIAFQPLGFTGDATCNITYSQYVGKKERKKDRRHGRKKKASAALLSLLHCFVGLPFRLLDCLGLATAPLLLVPRDLLVATVVVVVVFFFFLLFFFFGGAGFVRSLSGSCCGCCSVLRGRGALGGSGEARRKTEGDGIVIVSAMDGDTLRRVGCME